MRVEARPQTGDGSVRSIDTMAEAPFYIASTAPSARPRRTLKHDDTFAVFDSQGDMGASAGGPDGLFDHDTRYLSRLELLINGMQPLLLGSSVRDDNLTLTADLTNPDIFYDGHIALQRDVLHIVRTAYLWNSTAHQRIAICNHGEATISFTLALTFGADFADLFEVRSHKRERRGRLQEIVSSETDVAFVYTGLDGTERKTNIYFEPPPTQLLASAATYQLRLEVGKVLCIFMSVECLGSQLPERIRLSKGVSGRQSRSPFGVAIRRLHRDFEQCAQRSALPRHGGSSDVDHGDAGGIISLCRHPLVFHHLRS